MTDTQSMPSPALSDEELALLDAWWRAANYVSVGQIYLLDNPLLRRPLVREDIKPRLLGHWGTTPGLNLLWTHLNRLIRERDVNAIFLAGPGHGGRPRWRTRGSRAPTARSTRTSATTRTGCSGCSGSSRSPAGSPATSRRRRPGRSTRAASSATSSPTPTAPRWTTPTWSWRRSWATASSRPAAGHVVARQQVRRPGPRRRGAADPAPQRLQDRQPDRPGPDPARRARVSLLRGYGHEVLTVEGDDPADVHQQLAAALDRGPRPRSARSSARPGRTATSNGGRGR